MTHRILTDPLLTHSAKNGGFRGPKQRGMDLQIHASKALNKTAGDGIRTHDVQLGKIHWKLSRNPKNPKELQQLSVLERLLQGVAGYGVFSPGIAV